MSKKETLEEAAENYSKITLNKQSLMSDKQVNGFIAGAKWKEKESDIDIYLTAFEAYKASNTIDLNEESLLVEFNEWFEQFKK